MAVETESTRTARQDMTIGADLILIGETSCLSCGMGNIRTYRGEQRDRRCQKRLPVRACQPARREGVNTACRLTTCLHASRPAS